MIVPLSASARRISSILKRLSAGKKLSDGDRSFVERVNEANSPGRPSLRDTKLPIYASMGDCSGATGIPLSLLKHARRTGCPAFHASNRVDLAEFIKWAFRQDATTGEDGFDWGNELKKWLSKRAKIAHDRDANTVIDRAAVETGIHAAMLFQFSELDRVFCCELPPILKGLLEPAIRVISLKEIESLKTILRQKFSAISNAECGVRSAE